MLFRRKKKNVPRAPASAPCDHRHLYRAPVKPGSLQAQMIREGGAPIQIQVCDMNLEGIGVELPSNVDPRLEKGEVVSLELRKDDGTWSIDTPARVEHLEPGAKGQRCGLGFLHLGSLYAQMEDSLGRFFNRRRHVRVRPEFGQDILVRLRQAGHKPRGLLHDLSQSGLCVALDLVSSASIKEGTSVQVALELPGVRGTLEGPTRIVSKRRLGLREFVSLAFEFDAPPSLLDYVERRAGEIAAFSAELMASQSD